MQDRNSDPLEKAKEFINEEKGVATAEDAIAGACDIIAETVSDNAQIRKEIRALFLREGLVVSKATDAEKENQSLYNIYCFGVRGFPMCIHSFDI